MITPSMIYWMTRCDSIRHFFLDNEGTGLLLGLCLLLMIVTFLIGRFAGNGSNDLFSSMDDKECLKHKEAFQKVSRRSFYLACFLEVLIFVFNIIGSFVPTTKEMCAIAVIPKIANSESVQGLGTEIVDFAKDWLHELRPSNETKEKVKEAAKEVTKEVTKEATKKAAKELAK